MRLGGPECVLDPAEVTAFVHEQLGAHDVDGRSVCILEPDAGGGLDLHSISFGE